MDRVNQGAVLYISWQDAILSHFEAITGLKVRSNAMRKDAQVAVAIPALNTSLTLQNARRMALEIYKDAEILGTEPDGNPAFCYHTYGKGVVYFLSFPMEAVLADQPQAFEDTEYYRLYQYMFGALTDRKIIAKSSPKLAVTEHPADDGTCTVIALNYGKPETYSSLSKPDGSWTVWNIAMSLRPIPAAFSLPPHPRAFADSR